MEMRENGFLGQLKPVFSLGKFFKTLGMMVFYILMRGSSKMRTQFLCGNVQWRMNEGRRFETNIGGNFFFGN